MSTSVNIRLDNDLGQSLKEVCSRTGQEPEDIIKDALKRRLWLIEFENLREEAVPHAKKH